MTPTYIKLFAFLIFVATLEPICTAQVTSTTISGNDPRTPAEQQSRDAMRKVLEDSGKSFRDGMIALKGNRLSESKKKFDMAVEVFLFSTLDIQKEPALQGCYSQLLESIYRLEFPNGNQPPQLRSLSATCGWKWTEADLKLSDEVASLSRYPTQNEVSDGFGKSSAESSSLLDLKRTDFDGTENGEKIVQAQAGDTVAKVALRNGVQPDVVAKLNGLTPNSVLGAGREVRIPKPGPPEQSVKSTNECGEPPPIQNLRLGMSVREVEKTLGRRLILQNYTSRSLPNSSHSTIRSIRGTTSIYLGFHHSLLFYLSVDYDDSIKWSGMVEFQTAISTALKLPNAWTRKPSGEAKKLDCKDFVLDIEQKTSRRYSLTISDDRALRKLTEEYLDLAQKAFEDENRKKETFKP